MMIQSTLIMDQQQQQQQQSTPKNTPTGQQSDVRKDYIHWQSKSKNLYFQDVVKHTELQQMNASILAINNNNNGGGDESKRTLYTLTGADERRVRYFFWIKVCIWMRNYLQYLSEREWFELKRLLSNDQRGWISNTQILIDEQGRVLLVPPIINRLLRLKQLSDNLTTTTGPLRVCCESPIWIVHCLKLVFALALCITFMS